MNYKLFILLVCLLSTANIVIYEYTIDSIETEYNLKILDLTQDLNNSLQVLDDLTKDYQNRTTESYNDFIKINNECYDTAKKNMDNFKDYRLNCDNKISELSEMYNNQLNADTMILKPTYQQVLLFISRDHTDIKTHKWSYDCTEFTNELIANARDEGIFACTAELTYLDGKSGHVLVTFNTIDRGIIYVEPQTDDIMTKDFGIGSVYWTNKIVKISSCWD